MEKTRCKWVSDDPLYITYHDYEWGVPLFNEQRLFEFLTLETFQAGLSWITILRKRENFRSAFNNFNYKNIAQYTDQDVERLLADKGIIRNRLKIKAAIANAQAFLRVQEEFGSFSSYIWSFVEHTPLQPNWTELSAIAAKTELSMKLSIDLKKRGFKFVGPTVVYAFMQAIGMTNDHTTECFRHRELAANR